MRPYLPDRKCSTFTVGKKALGEIGDDRGGFLPISARQNSHHSCNPPGASEQGLVMYIGWLGFLWGLFRPDLSMVEKDMDIPCCALWSLYFYHY